ncbi:unnamed protein product [Brassica napus]|uniref:(rape) hypothetical protein n=1 Tax=Brassica napus TaxID=3708 RepID=A0A816V6V2_BRANA|nr:unnamed protein product [Brassica napus]
MGVFPGFGSWISKNSQQPLKAEAKGSENVESKSVSEKDTKNNAPAKKKKKKEYYDEKEKIRQEKLWHEEEEKHPWQNPPPKVKVTTKKGVYHMNLEITLGAPPELIYLWLIHPHGSSFLDEKKWRDLMITKSKKVLMEDGPREVFKVERSVVYDFFSLTSVRIPLHLIVEENRKDLTGKYKKEKVMLMKVFEGNYKVEPVYVDQERLCKKRLPKSPEEYRKCSGGQGKIGSKLTINQYFEPYPPFNLPPFSWYIRGNTVKTSKNLLYALQNTAKSFDPGQIEESKKYHLKTRVRLRGNPGIREGVTFTINNIKGGRAQETCLRSLTAESKRSENGESKSASEKDTNNAPAKKKKEVVYYDEKEDTKQEGLWHEAEKKHPWHNPPPKINKRIERASRAFAKISQTENHFVTNKKGLYHMNIELTVGTAPNIVYYVLTESDPFFDRKKWRDLMKNTSRKVLKENGPRRVVMVEKAVAYDFLSLTTISIPIHLTMEENRKHLTTKYKKEQVLLMKEFHGNYKVEPIYVDQERLCKKRLPNNPEEYKKCSGGQGRIGSKFTINHYFQPYPPFSLPPLSCFIRGITIKTSKKLLNLLQDMAFSLRQAGPPSE